MRQKTCEFERNKRCFSEKDAKKCAEKYASQSFNGYLRAYKCMWCKYWHLTHKKNFIK